MLKLVKNWRAATAFLICLAACWSSLLLVLALERSSYTDEFGLYEFGDLFINNDEGHWIGIAVFAVASLIWTALILLVSTFMQSLAQKESLWGHVLICGLLPLGLLALDRAEYEALYLSICGVIAGASWWWIYRRAMVRREPESYIPKFFKVLLSVGLALNLYSFYNGWPVDYYSELNFDDVRENKEIGSHIEGGVIAGGELLLYNNVGSLFAYDRSNWDARLLKAESVIDVEKSDDQIWILSATGLLDDIKYEDELPPGEFTLSTFKNQEIVEIDKMPFGTSERPIALAIHNDTPVVVAQRKILLFDPDRSKWDQIILDQPIGGKQMIRDWVSDAIVSDDGKYLYVGINAGELGGDLYVINLQSGSVGWAGDRSGRKDCEIEDLDPCTAITGLVNSNANPGCLIRAQGISHWSTFGQLTQVCGNDVELLFSKSRDPLLKKLVRYIRTIRNHQEPLHAHEPFFDLAMTENGNLWSVSYIWLYQMQDGTWKKQERIDFQKHGDIWIGVDTNDLLVVLTARNAQRSLSGTTPLLIQ